MRALEVQEFFDPHEQTAIVQMLAKAFQLGQSPIEAELAGKHGKRISFLFHCARTFLAGQSCIFGTGLDISARKQAGLSLQARERALYSSVNAIVITCYEGGENHIEYANPAFERITGYMLDDIKGQYPRFMRIEGCDAHEHYRIHEALQEQRSVRGTTQQRKTGKYSGTTCALIRSECRWGSHAFRCTPERYHRDQAS